MIKQTTFVVIGSLRFHLRKDNKTVALALIKMFCHYWPLLVSCMKLVETGFASFSKVFSEMHEITTLTALVHITHVTGFCFLLITGHNRITCESLFMCISTSGHYFLIWTGPQSVIVPTLKTSAKSMNVFFLFLFFKQQHFQQPNKQKQCLVYYMCEQRRPRLDFTNTRMKLRIVIRVFIVASCMFSITHCVASFILIFTAIRLPFLVYIHVKLCPRKCYKIVTVMPKIVLNTVCLK